MVQMGIFTFKEKQQKEDGTASATTLGRNCGKAKSRSLVALLAAELLLRKPGRY